MHATRTGLFLMACAILQTAWNIFPFPNYLRSQQVQFINMSTPSQAAVSVCPDAPLKNSIDMEGRVRRMVNFTLADMDALSMEICRDRSAIDRKFMQWYALKKEMNEMLNEYQDKHWHSGMKDYSDSYDAAHFAPQKKRKL